METLSPIGRIFTADIEAVGLIRDVNKREDVHIINLKDYDTGEIFSFFDDFVDRINAVWLDDFEDGFKQGDLLDGVRWMNDCKILIMHNVAGYDAIALERAFPDDFKRDHFVSTDHHVFPFATCDTLTLSYLLNPERRLPPQAYGMGKGNIGAHGIESYGIRMGRLKPQHEDWTHLSAEMIHRVEEDAEIGEWTFDYLMKEFSEQLLRPNTLTGLSIVDAYMVEFRMAFAVAYQATRAFAIDTPYIHHLLAELDVQIIATEQAFRPHMPMRLKKKKLSEDQIDKSVLNMSGVAGVEYENYMLNGDQRGSYAATNWSVTNPKGKYGALVTKYIPAAVGFIQDHSKPPVSGPFTPLIWEEIPLGNRDEVKQILFARGWRAVNYNDAELEYMEENGDLPKPWSGKIDDESLEVWEKSSYTVPEWCRGIAAWYILQSRRTQLLNAKDQAYFNKNAIWPRQTNGKHECRGILAKAYCHSHGRWFNKTAQAYYEHYKAWPVMGHWRVPAEAFSCATNTFRMRHKGIVNIPTRGLYGHQMRLCFIAGPGGMLLGCDGSGLELRMLAHFMADSIYTDTVLNGDIHTYNKEMAGLSTRDMAKKFIYMFLYGSGIPNLSRQIGIPEHEMGKCVAKFKESLPALDNLIDRVQGAAKRNGYLMSVDGRWGRVRSKNGKIALNTALNVLLQMTGSLVMKYAHIKAEELCVECSYIESYSKFPMVAHVHDEAQTEIRENEVEILDYWVAEDKWKDEEKRQHIDKKGRIWSAPEKLSVHGGMIGVRRMFHIVGHNYCTALVWAGEKLKLRCDTAGEYKIAYNWGGTH